ncbi:hypothetical protein PF010_g31295 [Phytophthora fragariae]|uniref:Uncharacterized protein n=1 Tax=Phytophthora fragariae TaxID=53985 RepID=A0A6G0JHY8_9STRA|nr:hypothetical protein PF010_g31295 [Phytophthora fragariae]
MLATNLRWYSANAPVCVTLLLRSSSLGARSFRPIMSSFGLYPVPECLAPLYAYVAQYIHWSQSSCASVTYIATMSFQDRWKRSTSPSSAGR